MAVQTERSIQFKLANRGLHNDRHIDSSVLLVPTVTGLVPSHRQGEHLNQRTPLRYERAITQVGDLRATSGIGQAQTREQPVGDPGGATGAPPRENRNSGTPPPHEPGIDATGESDRERKIREILERNQIALTHWQEEHDGIPVFPARENIDAVKGLVITRRILELADDPEAVDVKLDRDSTSEDLQVFVTERRAAPVSDPKILAYWAEEDIFSDQADLMQLLYYKAIKDGTIDISDFIIQRVTINKFGPDDDADIFVKSLMVHPDQQQHGIGKATEKALETFGTKQGFKYIVGENEDWPREKLSERTTRDIFIQKFERIPYNELDSQVQERLTDRYAGQIMFGHIEWLTAFSLSPDNPPRRENLEKAEEDERRLRYIAEHSIQRFMGRNEEAKIEAANDIAEILTTPTDIENLLDDISLFNTQKARELATILHEQLAGRFGDVSLYNLVWLKANLPAFIETPELESAVAKQIPDKRYADALIAASRWVEAYSKTIARIELLTDTMDAFEKGVIAQLDTIPLREILINNARPDPKNPTHKRTISEKTLRNLTIEPVIAQSVINPDRGEEAKLAFLSNARIAAATGRGEISFTGDGPMGFIISYRGVPQGFVTFDIYGSQIVIRQMQGAKEYTEIDQAGAITEIEQSPGALQDIDFPGVAIDLVANVCHLLGLPYQQESMVVEVISGHNIAEAVPNPAPEDPYTFPLEQAIKIYDDTADRKGFHPDTWGNWISPLNRLLLE
jgi:GNAT superfamily N-acetyltransferase